MYPLTCKNGEAHDFGFNSDGPDREYLCLKCGAPHHVYNDVRLRVDRFRSMVSEMSRSNNGGNPHFLATAFYNAMTTEHRTLQQSFISSIVQFIKMMAEMPTDLRNEAAVEWCKKASEIDAIFPRI